MAPSTALVVAGGDPSAARTVHPHDDDEDVDLPVDLSQLPMIPMPKSLLLINNFVANTTRFLNHFAHECEERITRVSTSLTRVEIMLAILEAKLDSIPDLTVTENEIEAAEQSISGTAPLVAATEPSLGIDSQDLPSTDDGFGFVPPPPPPPPPSSSSALTTLPSDSDAIDETRLVNMPPPPPPPPPPSSMDGDASTAIVVAPAGELSAPGLFDDDDDDDDAASGPPLLKLKDDPVYAKYFTMQRLGIPTPVIEQKLQLDGMDPNILRMDPDGPSPSSGNAPTSLPPPPPSLSMPSEPPQRPPSGNIGMPFPLPQPLASSPTSSTSSRAESLFGAPPPPPDLFGALPSPPLPPMPNDDDDDSSSDDDGIQADALRPQPPQSPQPSFLKLKDDPAFEKYFKMRKLGMPDGLIQHKLMMDGVTLDILSMDPEGPSPNDTAAPSASDPSVSALPPSPPPPPLPPAAAAAMARPMGLPPPPMPKYDDDSDDDFDSD